MKRVYSGNAAAAEVGRFLHVLILSPADIAKMGVADLDFALRIARRARLLGRLASRLHEADLLDGLPEPASDQLRSALIYAESRARLARWEMNRVAWSLVDQQSVQIVALKGCAYLLLELPNAAGRFFADVDLLVAERDLGTIEACLASHGWRGTKVSRYDQHYFRAWTHEIPPMVHAEREVEVDVHHNILQPTARLKPSSSLLLDSAQPIPDSRFQVLSNVDIILHAMAHLMFNSDMADAVRELVDIDDLLRYFSSRRSDFWNQLLTRAEQLDLRRPAYYALRYTSQLLGTPVPAHVQKRIAEGAPPAIVIWLMDRIVPKALFPQHPDFPSRSADLARLLLYMRAHWISMPPLLLTCHLTYKFFLRHVKSRRWFPKAAKQTG